MIQPEPEDLPKDNPKLEIAVLRTFRVILFSIHNDEWKSFQCHHQTALRCLCIGKLETIRINIELADNSKCIPKGIVRDLLIKIDKFILPIDFIILDVLEDFRMPIILGRPLLTTAHAKIDVFKKSISLEVEKEKVIFKLRNDLHDMKSNSVLMFQSNIIIEKDELMNIESDLFTYNTNTCESCHILAIDTDLFTYEIVTQETYDEIAHKCCLNTQDVIGEKTKTILGKKKSHWEGRNNETQERLINNLHDEWFKGTSDDEDDIEGIINYLKPTTYDGFIDLDEEEYNKRRCRLLGMPYIAPLPLIIEQVEITRYSLGPGEVYTKVKVLNMEELTQTRNNIATIRRDIMDEVYESYVDEVT
ncbi:zinc knuckle CX2CX4HX4C containing protein [Tanacetum coccineum]|uniref:Zinc knuckle CX2CX4HX4C containing protein n=1 Tax=Tanacetum coccineum TaxID=301880 RepID=A0ABQ5G7B6_9ASTR